MTASSVLVGSLLVVMLYSHLVLGYESSDAYGTMAEYDQSPAANWLQEVLLQRATRGGKRCGKRRCYGVCCGGKRCCKKGWSCRYMNNIRLYTCIP